MPAKNPSGGGGMGRGGGNAGGGGGKLIKPKPTKPTDIKKPTPKQLKDARNKTAADTKDFRSYTKVSKNKSNLRVTYQMQDPWSKTQQRVVKPKRPVGRPAEGFHEKTKLNKKTGYNKTTFNNKNRLEDSWGNADKPNTKKYLADKKNQAKNAANKLKANPKIGRK